jgi:hypothetical protein
MTELDSKFKSLRVNLRKQGLVISEDVFKRHHPATINIDDEICVFCNSTSKITKEHVIPKWLFEKNTESTFISSVNRQTQLYNKAVIPTCSECNNSLLAAIEKYLIKVVQGLDAHEVISNDNLSNIIRWLEIIDYKLQVYDCRRKYIKYGDSEYDYHLGSLPAAMIRHFMDFNPFKARDYLRRAQHRLTVKAKTERINSIVVFDTTESHFNFFSQPDEYIFVSFPKFNCAIFYFLTKKFDNNNDASDEALYIMEKVFET